jgi:hypothetical protein
VLAAGVLCCVLRDVLNTAAIRCLTSTGQVQQPQHVQSNQAAMAVTVGNVLLLTGSVLAAACALFWPQIEQAYWVHPSPHGGAATAAANGSNSKCPLVKTLLP